MQWHGYVFQIQNTDVKVPRLNNNNEVIHYQIIRYISSNEDFWYFFSFHLENGQRVYFTNVTAVERGMNPSKTTLTEFFKFCNNVNTFGAIALTLFYSEYHTISHEIKQ